jgi:hypothetical protein
MRQSLDVVVLSRKSLPQSVGRTALLLLASLLAVGTAGCTGGSGTQRTGAVTGPYVGGGGGVVR